MGAACSFLSCEEPVYMSIRRITAFEFSSYTRYSSNYSFVLYTACVNLSAATCIMYGESSRDNAGSCIVVRLQAHKGKACAKSVCGFNPIQPVRMDA